jgi:hypothetical protein
LRSTGVSRVQFSQSHVVRSFAVVLMATPFVFGEHK